MAGVRTHEDLRCWQLSKRLKDRVFAFTATELPGREFKYRDQIRAAARSATDRLAEGFCRYYSREFARFCSMARGSLGEVKNQLGDARDEKYLTEDEFREMWALASQAMGATTNLLKYLLRCPPRGGWRDAYLNDHQGDSPPT
jgi:four helix bundle protein